MLRRSFTLSAPAAAAAPVFKYCPIFPLHDNPREHGTPFRLLTKNYVEKITLPSSGCGPLSGKQVLSVDRRALSLLSQEAFHDVAHLLRPGHLQQLRNIIDDPEASDNDRYVALTLLKNANIAAGRVLPGCQDTGTAIVSAYRGMNVWTMCRQCDKAPGVGADEECNPSDEAALSRGVFKTYTGTNLRYSQMSPLTMYDEKNTGTNLPAQIDIAANPCTGSYDFLFMAKGGGSANKTYLFQETKALLNPKGFRKFLEEKLPSLGTSACPPYHLAVVVGGTSAEQSLKTAKYASARYLDHLPTTGGSDGTAFRDTHTEEMVLDVCRKSGIGAQFGGKYFAHDVRVVRLPRHGASCPVAIAVSCSADRQVMGRIDEEGVWLEQLETNPAKYLPDVSESDLLKIPAVKIDLNMGMDRLRQELAKYPVKTRFSLSGTIIVARDIAHAKLREKLENGEPLPEYFRNNCVYYAGPAKTPEGMPSGSFGPTTAGRMDAFVDLFQKAGGSFVMLAKGNRSKAVTDACKANNGFYLGSIGGPAAILAQDSIKKVTCIDMQENGMEAVWQIDVVDFPAFMVVDNKGNDFFAAWTGGGKK